MFWGTTIDPSKARKYDLPLVDNILPVHIESPPTATPTTTKVLTKPTAHLPGDHGTAPGENTNPAFPSAQPGATATATPAPTADEGWFPSLSNLMSNQKWFFGAVGIVSLFGIGMAVFFWRRRMARLANYSSLPAGDEMSMSALMTSYRSGAPAGTSRPTRELYDAFGEVSDDDDEHYGDERQPLREVSSGAGFQPEFLDEDHEAREPSAAGTGRYRDDPESSQRVAEDGRRTPSPNGSGDTTTESWEHASS